MKTQLPCGQVMDSALVVAALAAFLYVTLADPQCQQPNHSQQQCTQDVSQTFPCKKKTFYVVLNQQSQVNWNSAENLCRKYLPSGSLASIINQEEQRSLDQYLASLLFPLSSTFWVSGSRRVDWGNEFRWLEQARPLNYTNWAEVESPSDPRHEGDFVCVQRQNTSSGFKWKTHGSMDYHWPLCQIF